MRAESNNIRTVRKQIRTGWLFGIFAGLIMSAIAFSQQSSTGHHHEPAAAAPEVWGIECGVSDLDRAIDFYTGALGFEVEERKDFASSAVLKNGAFRLILRQSEASPRPDGSAGIYLNMRIRDLGAAVEAARAHGANIKNPTPGKFALGLSVSILDPSGNHLNLLQLDGDQMAPGSQPAVFNIGVMQLDLKRSESFYTDLGFRVFSREFLPKTLPLDRQGVAALVLHGTAESSAQPGTRNGTLVLVASDHQSIVQRLQTRGLIIERNGVDDSTRGYVLLRDPSGNQLKLMDAASAPEAVVKAAPPNTKLMSTPELARAAFERFKQLEGRWKGRSTKGWEEAVSFRTIAGGSVVVETSFDAHPNETMMTMFHPDGDRLMLTHYCVAKNQPRLQATSFEDDGRTITFTFLDATNLPSRDRGHMDKAIFRFIDDRLISTQWTWYQNGKESWMEEIRLERIQ